MPSPRSVGFLCMAFQSNFLLVYIKQNTSVHLIFNDVICKHPSPPTMLPPVTCQALTLCSPVPPPPFPLHPLPHHVGSQGRAGGQSCQSNLRRHAATPQTPITTQQGRGLATAWQPHGPIRVHNNRDQRMPRKVKVVSCVHLCVRTYTRSNVTQSQANTYLQV